MILITLVVLGLLIFAGLIIFAWSKKDDNKANEEGHILTHFSLSEKSYNDMAEDDAGKEYYFSLYENDYEAALLAVLGEEYLKDKALMRVEDREICGHTCAVFKVGINSEELFTTIDWFAVNSEGTVYCYDVVMDEWSEYTPTIAVDYDQIDSCLYMLNEYLNDRFSTEYYDMQDEIKQAVYENQNATDGVPTKLIGMNEEIPDGYYADPMEKRFYPVYNFADFDSVIEHFSEYFTAEEMEEIEYQLFYYFLDFEDTIYLVREDRGYGTVTVDFDSIDYSHLEREGFVFIDKLLSGEKDGQYKVGFACEDRRWKIDSVEQMDTEPGIEPGTELKLEPGTEPKQEPKQESKQEPEPKPETESKPQTETKAEIGDKLYGIAFLGFGEELYEADLESYLPVIEHNGVENVLLEGHSFFLLIPASEDIFFEIYGIGKDSNGDESRWQAAETYPGAPVLIRCNDWYDPPSALVNVCGGSEVYELFTPTYIARENKMKLENGAYELETIK